MIEPKGAETGPFAFVCPARPEAGHAQQSRAQARLSRLMQIRWRSRVPLHDIVIAGQAPSDDSNGAFAGDRRARQGDQLRRRTHRPSRCRLDGIYAALQTEPALPAVRIIVFVPW